jgi:hypothetical protein
MNTQFELYRYTHPDGSAKDWAYSVATVDQQGRYLVRWGKQNHLVGNQPCTYDVVLKREREKLDKGYRHKGRVTLDTRGNLVTSGPGTQTPVPTIPPSTRPKRKGSPLDIAKLLGEGADFYF